MAAQSFCGRDAISRFASTARLLNRYSDIRIGNKNQVVRMITPTPDRGGDTQLRAITSISISSKVMKTTASGNQRHIPGYTENRNARRRRLLASSRCNIQWPCVNASAHRGKIPMANTRKGTRSNRDPDQSPILRSNPTARHRDDRTTPGLVPASFSDTSKDHPISAKGDGSEHHQEHHHQHDGLRSVPDRSSQNQR